MHSTLCMGSIGPALGCQYYGRCGGWYLLQVWVGVHTDLYSAASAHCRHGRSLGPHLVPDTARPEVTMLPPTSLTLALLLASQFTLMVTGQ